MTSPYDYKFQSCTFWSDQITKNSTGWITFYDVILPIFSVRGQQFGITLDNLPMNVGDFEDYSKQEDYGKKRSMFENVAVFEWLVCSDLLTCVWTMHHLTCFVYSSFTGHCERQTHRFSVCKDTCMLNTSKVCIFQQGLK